MKIKITFLAVLLGCGIQNMEAQLIDVLQAHIGTAIFPATESLYFESGKPTNIYGAYAPAQTLGLGASKFLTDKFQLNANVEFMNTFKPHYNLISQKTSLNIKYNFIAPDVYRFSPYIIGGGNCSFIWLVQSDFKREYITPDGYSEDGVKVSQITTVEPTLKLPAPAFGGSIGAGLDINVFEVVSVFGEVTYNYIFTKETSIQSNYNLYNSQSPNKSNLTYTSINFGVRLYMY